MKNRNLFALLVIPFILGSCGILGFHLKVHNPKNPGKDPKFSEEIILLGELTKYRSCFDVHYYDLSVEVKPKKKTLIGRVEIHSIAQEDFDTLQIDLDRTFDITSLKDKESGLALEYTRIERAVFVKYPKKKGEKFILAVDYNGKPNAAEKPPWKGGFVWKKDKDGKYWDGVACETEGASVWWALKDHTSDEPDSMRLHYTVPKNLVGVGNGRLEGKVENGNTTTYNWHVSYPINTYNVTIYVGDFKVIKEEYIGITGKKLAINHYVLERNYETAKDHFKQVHPILKSFEEMFGEYPWYRDGFKLVESPYEGMEHQTAIAYGNGYKNDADSVTDYIVLHETAHEWWGNSITAKDLSDVWLQEGFATYAEALYFEDKDDKKSYENQLFFYRIFIKNKYPVVGVKDRRWFHYKKSADAYMKGAWILHTLRNQIDEDTVFFDILKTFAETYKRQLVESKDFINLVNEKTGKNYDWFFDQYLYKNEAPELEYAVSESGKLYYRWINVPEEFNRFKVKIRSQKKIIVLKPSNEVKIKTIPKTIYGGWSFNFEGDGLYAIKENKALLDNIGN